MDNPVKVYCLFATMAGDEDPSPWLLCAVDEHSWEGGADGNYGESEFGKARALAEKNGWQVREVWFEVDYASVARAFGPSTAEARLSIEQSEVE